MFKIPFNDLICSGCGRYIKPRSLGYECRYCNLVFNVYGEVKGKHSEVLSSKRNRKEFKINEYLTLKLIGRETVIFLKDRRFSLCKRVVINIPHNKTHLYDNFNSIDEIIHFTSRYNVPPPANIKPEVEFWAHCSNLQAWVENNYDTRLLHTNLSFPLLTKLTRLGDPVAKRVFKEEIAKRISSGYAPVKQFLIEKGYLNYLNDEEIKSIEI